MVRLSKLHPTVGRLSPLIERAPRGQPGGEQQRDAAAPWRRLYKTARWRKLRIKVFIRDRFTCQCGCGRVEGNTSLLVADHKVPHRGDERRFWDETNIHTLFKECHDSLKQKEEQASLHHRGVWD